MPYGKSIISIQAWKSKGSHPRKTTLAINTSTVRESDQVIRQPGKMFCSLQLHVQVSLICSTKDKQVQIVLNACQLASRWVAKQIDSFILFYFIYFLPLIQDLRLCIRIYLKKSENLDSFVSYLQNKNEHFFPYFNSSVRKDWTYKWTKECHFYPFLHLSGIILIK